MARQVETSQRSSLDAFLIRKAEFDPLLAELPRPAASPEAVLRGDAAWPTRRLRDIADRHFRRGGQAASRGGRPRSRRTDMPEHHAALSAELPSPPQRG